jgi:hypothetical protein
MIWLATWCIRTTRNSISRFTEVVVNSFVDFVMQKGKPKRNAIPITHWLEIKSRSIVAVLLSPCPNGFSGPSTILTVIILASRKDLCLSSLPSWLRSLCIDFGKPMTSVSLSSLLKRK